MSAVAFDTYAAVKTLREAGADEAMAEAIVNTASAAVGAGHDELATKGDLRTALEPPATKAALYRETGALRSEMRWMFALQGALIPAVPAAGRVVSPGGSPSGWGRHPGPSA